MEQIPELSAFFLAYNEEGNIKRLIETADAVLKNIAKKYEIIIVLYEGSTDNTLKIINQLKNKYKNLKLVIQKFNEKGYGNAVKIGIKASKYQYIFYCDGDLQFDINEITNLLPYIKDYEIVTGYRKNRKDPLTRKITSRVYNQLITTTFNFKVRDIDCAFKIFKKKIFEKINITSKTGMVLPEIYAKATKLGYKIKEIPITHYPRIAGKSVFESKFALVKFSVIRNLIKEMNSLKKELEHYE